MAGVAGAAVVAGVVGVVDGAPGLAGLKGEVEHLPRQTGQYSRQALTKIGVPLQRCVIAG